MSIFTQLVSPAISSAVQNIRFKSFFIGVIFQSNAGIRGYLRAGYSLFITSRYFREIGREVSPTCKESEETKVMAERLTK